jgi:hypothetical protein
MEINMKVQYTFDEETATYYANGESSVGYVSGAYDTIAEMVEDINLQIESIYMDEEESYNEMQESLGSFTRFKAPLIKTSDLVQVDFKDYFDE